MTSDDSAALPPTTNRGAEITNAEAGIDWLEFSVTEPDWNRIAERLTVEGDAWRELDHGALGYAHYAVSDREIDVMWDERRPEVHVRLTGNACSRLTEDVLLSVVGWVTTEGGGFSRVGLEATVPYSVATVEQFIDAIERGEHVTRVHQAGLTRQLSLRRSEFDRLLGRTLYVGSPTSRRRLRVYDKGIESGGLIEGTRIELQERDEAADECARQLLGSEPLAVVFAGRLAGFIDFREQDRENVTRWRRAAWYERLIGEVGRARAVAPVEDTTPEEAEEWVRRQVSPTFAALARLGMLDVGALLDEGRKRLNPKHQRWLRAARVRAERSEPQAALTRDGRTHAGHAASTGDSRVRRSMHPLQRVASAAHVSTAWRARQRRTTRNTCSDRLACDDNRRRAKAPDANRLARVSFALGTCLPTCAPPAD